MRVLVCGGREYEDRTAVYEALDALHQSRVISCVIAGDAQKGVYRLAADWARFNGIELDEYALPETEWLGTSEDAGEMAGLKMLELGKPEAVIAFPGGAGTTQLLRQARAAGLPVWEPLARKT